MECIVRHQQGWDSGQSLCKRNTTLTPSTRLYPNPRVKFDNNTEGYDRFIYNCRVHFGRLFSYRK